MNPYLPCVFRELFKCAFDEGISIKTTDVFGMLIDEVNEFKIESFSIFS